MQIETRDVAVFVFSVVFAIYFTVIAYKPDFMFNAANFTFCFGIVHVLAGMLTVVRNFDIFKALRYMSYKREFRRTRKNDYNAMPLSLAEYALERKKLPFKTPFIIGFPALALSIFFVLMQ